MILRPFCVFSPFSLFISCKVLYNWTKAEAFLSVFAVVLLAEDVDRNFYVTGITNDQWVVLRAEDVDRNKNASWREKVGSRSSSSRRTWIEISVRLFLRSFSTVVLLAEDVDRNFYVTGITSEQWLSSSSRRTWIEICRMNSTFGSVRVVLLAEDVDRNLT